MARGNEVRSIDIDITPKQEAFIFCDADEVLFGGAAGGGKSYGQVIDALLYALKYPRSKQIIFRESYPELERSILRTMLSVYPLGKYKYNQTSHTFTFINGSIIDCGYLQSDNDCYNYQSAEYDVIRFDELTHFSEFTYTYMFSRLRGANKYPKYMKSSTNPTGAGRVWVKERFVDIGEWNTIHNVVVGYSKDGTPRTQKRIFIPSKVWDNDFLMESDPEYLTRLENITSEAEKQGLLYGEWDYFDGQYFDEFSREKHVCEPFSIPSEWRRYVCMDYGLDMLAVYWVAVDSLRNCYVYRELCESNLPIGEAAKKVLDYNGDDKVYAYLAPPDLWNRSQETGKSKALIFGENGLDLTKSNNDREAGWLAIKELLKVDSNGESRLHIFSNCTRLIKNLPELQRDPKHPTDTLNEPHEITHSPDALRYFAIYWTSPSKSDTVKKVHYRPDQLEDLRNARTKEEREYIIKKMGGIPA